MKKLFIICSLLLTTPLWACLSTYDLKFEQGLEKNEVTFYFTAREVSSSICHITVDNLTLEKDNKWMSSRQSGKVSFKTYVDPAGICLTAFGKNSGSLSLQLGYGFPKISVGSYRVEIDNEFYGMLEVMSGTKGLISQFSADEVDCQ